MSDPLVSVICLCHNHRDYIRESVLSVLNQSYPSLEILIVDDFSEDSSQEVISGIQSEFPQVQVILLDQNHGNCAAFNRGFRLSKGTFIIDLAADDILEPERIAKQIRLFQSSDESYGVVYSDATYIDQSGKAFRNHFSGRSPRVKLQDIPQGTIYRNILASYFIPAPTMMIRRSVLEQLGGYDEKLSYEDFDFWVRSSRLFKYGFIPECLTRIRRLQESLSSRLYSPDDNQLESTYQVCLKARDLNRTAEESQALVKRINYELRQAVFSGNFKEGRLFMNLLRDLNEIKWGHLLLSFLIKTRINLNFLRNAYLSFRYP